VLVRSDEQRLRAKLTARFFSNLADSGVCRRLAFKARQPLQPARSGRASSTLLRVDPPLRRARAARRAAHRVRRDRRGGRHRRGAPGAWPFGVHAYAGRKDNDLILWLAPINAIVNGDSLSDFGDGLDVQLGGRKHVTRDDVVLRLRRLLDLPVELVLPAHGERTDPDLERVLQRAAASVSISP
jgi:hypothetical protein